MKHNNTLLRKPVHKELWIMAKAHKADCYTATFFSYCVYLGGLASMRALVYYGH